MSQAGVILLLLWTQLRQQHRWLTRNRGTVSGRPRDRLARDPRLAEPNRCRPWHWYLAGDHPRRHEPPPLRLRRRHRDRFHRGRERVHTRGTGRLAAGRRATDIFLVREISNFISALCAFGTALC